MKRPPIFFVVLNAAFIYASAFAPTAVRAADAIYFSTSVVGTSKSVSQWGIDTAWASEANMRLSLLNFGTAPCDVVRLTYHLDEALQADGTLGATTKSTVDYAVSLAKLAGSNVPISLSPDTGTATNSYYLDSGGAVNPERWAAAIKATALYLKNTYGLTVSGVEAANEPDYWSGQPTAAQVNSINTILKSDTLFQNAVTVGPSTLSPNQTWYNGVKGTVDYGSTHKLGGTATEYVNFIKNVQANGDKFCNPEIHSMAECVLGAEYGMVQGIFWGPAMNARGKFVQASDGQRLGYAENLGKETAAAIYRGTDKKIGVFAGGFERQGTTTYYRVVCTDRQVYFNGVGPISQYMVKAAMSDQGSYVDVRYGSDAIGLGSSLDGNQWKIVNRQTGQVLQVSAGSTANGGVVNTASYSGSSYQFWNITRSDDGYYALFNANSGITMDVFNNSLVDGGVVDQWGAANNYTQQWTIESAGNGYFYILNGNSGKYLNGSTTQAYQSSLNGSSLQQWQFVRVNRSTGTLKAQYKFEGNVLDSVGTNHAAVYGTATYGTGVAAAATGAVGTGQAISLNGSTTYAQLPSGVASSKDITISTWVKWNGGNNWQRIFDFGNNTTSYMFLTPKSGDGTMRFAITTASGTGEEILDTDALPTGQWVNVAVTLDGNTGILYVNGKATVAGRIVTNPSDVNSTVNYIGKSQYSSDPLFSGMIDDFRIYDYALSSAEMTKVALASHYVWTGAGGSEWSTAALTTKNWQLTFNNASTDYFNGDTILFDDSASNFTITTASNVTPLDTVFNNAVAYTLTGTAGIAGSGGLTKNGTGVLTINNVNTYLGTTALNSGAVILNGSVSGAAVTVNAATLTENSSGSIIGGGVLSNLGVTSLAGTNLLGGIRATGPGSITVSGGITSTTNVGQISVGDSVGDTASFVVSAGVLNANGTSGASVVIGAFETASGTFSVTGGTVNAAGDVWVASAAGAAGALNVSGTVRTSAKMIVNGAGGVNVARTAGSFGSVSLNSYGSLTAAAITGGAGTSRFNFNGGVLYASGSNSAFIQNFTQAYVQAGGAVLNTSGNNVTVAQALQHDPSLASADGGLSKQGSGILTLSASNSFTGAVNVNGGFIKATSITNFGAGSSIVFNGGGLIFGAAFDPSVRAITLNIGGGLIDTNGYSVALSKTLSGVGGLTKLGSGVLTLSGAEAFLGGINIEAGKVVLSSTETNVFSLDVQTASNATLSIAGGTHTLDVISGSGTTVVAGSATLTVACLVQDTLILGGTASDEATSVATEYALPSDQTKAVPEPAVWAMIVCATGLLWRMRRRRA